MGQRQGRVDHLGWGRADQRFINVHFMKHKETYEEHVFYTLTQRNQWF
jgi:hypothetical protein